MNKIGYRPTWAEVNLANIAYNINSIRKIVPEETEILATVKADAYGHGLIPVSKKLISLGIKYLGVASIDEAITLRHAGIKSSILVLGGIFLKDCPAIIDYGLTQTVFSEEIAVGLNAQASKKRKPVKIHIKIDTGMGRIGIWHKDALTFVKAVNKLAYLKIEGIFTHLSSADSDADFTRRQISLFKELLKKIDCCGISIPLKHAANSLGMVNFKSSHFNLIRPGIVIYGLYPQRALNIKIKPVLSLKTKVVYLKKVPGGRSISYNKTYVTKRKTVIAVLPVGYGDGYPRALSNKAEVIIKGRRVKVVGRVCMDQTMVDAGSVKNLSVGDEVTLIGQDKNSFVSAEELAALSDTICYEIVCGLGNRIPRVYLNK